MRLIPFRTAEADVTKKADRRDVTGPDTENPGAAPLDMAGARRPARRRRFCDLTEERQG